ncbi:MAG: hypothetical protein ACI808_002628 [Paraglaciecola sp.]
MPDAFWKGYGENLLKASDPTCLAIYQGMYFILNIIEAVRFKESDEEPRKWLFALNEVLREYLKL